MKNFTKSFMLFCMILLFSQVANAANITWNTAVSGNWSDGTKWSGGVAPGVNDTAVVTTAGTYTITMDVAPSIQKLVIGNATGFQTLNLNGQILTIAKNSTVNAHGILNFSNSSTLSGAGSLTNNGRIVLNNSNTINVSVTNADTIFVDHNSNTITGTFTTTASSVVYLRCASYIGQLTFSTGWTNNGKVIMASVSCYYALMQLTSGTLVNAASGTIQSAPNPNCYGYNQIDAAIDNQGALTIDYHLRVYTQNAASANTGTVTFSGAYTLTYYNGTVNWTSGTINFFTGSNFTINTGKFNWNGGATTGSGQFNFESTTASFNTATMPAQPTYFNSSRLASSLGAISNAKKITLNATDTISANLNNTDTIFVDHYLNIFTGTFTNTAASVLYFRCQSYIGQLTFSSGWTNNGKIVMASVSCYYALLQVNSGTLLNPSGKIIQSAPNPNCYGYNQIEAALDNQGTINIDYHLRVYTSIGASTNTGTVTYSGAFSLSYYNGTVDWNSGTINFFAGSTFNLNNSKFSWNGGSTTGSGQFNFESSRANFNTAAMPSQPTYFNSSRLASSLGSISNSKKITLNANDTISANLTNNDTIFVDHYLNLFTGSYTTVAASVLYFRCQSYVGQLTFSSGWINNGKIVMASVSCYYALLQISSGTLLNPAAGVIQSAPNPNCYGYNQIEAAISNSGSINIDYHLRIYTSAAASTNTGTVNFTGAYTLTWYNGTLNWNSGNVNFVAGAVMAFSGATLNWNGGSSPVLGQFNFESSTGNFTTAATPNARMYFNSSTLASPSLPLTSSHLIELYANDTIKAAVFNTDTIRVHHYQNKMTGALTTSASSVLYLDCSAYVAQLTFSAGWTNNGKILLSSTGGCYYPLLQVTSGTLVNSPTGIIQNSPNAGCYGYNQMDLALDNQGTMNIDYPLHIYTSAGPSANTGAINFTSGYTLTYHNGILNWDGGSASGNGVLAFESAVGSFNTATMPSIPTYFNSSRLGSTLGGISNARRITLNANDTISANLNNTDTILVDHYQNICSGDFTNTASSLLHLRCQNYVGELKFNNGWTNNGKILLASLGGCYYAYLRVAAGTLVNAGKAIIQNSPNAGCYGYNQIDAAVDNQGTVNIDYPLNIYTSTGASANTGTMNFTQGYILTYWNGTFNWNGGAASGNGTLAFQGALGSFNTATMPTIPTYFNTSRLASTLGGISNARKITFNNLDTISANLNNTDTIFVDHYQNVCTGNFTNTASSLLHLRCQNYVGELKFNNGWTNNGKLLLSSLGGCYYAYLRVAAGTLVNAATGLIQNSPNAGCYGYNQIDAAVDNQGTMNIDYPLNIYTSTGASANTGTMNFTQGYILTYWNGTFNWNGGAASGNGTLAFQGALGSFNTATMPTIPTYFNTSRLASTLGGISNAKRITFNNLDTISANLNNTDTIFVDHYQNVCAGNFTNTASSLLHLRCQNYVGELKFNSGWTNNGKILMASLGGCYYGWFRVDAGKLVNAASGVIQSSPNAGCYGYNQFDSRLDNFGSLEINYQLNASADSFINKTSGIVKGSAQLNLSPARLINEGIIAPGASPGALSLNTDVVNKSTSSWNIEIGGLTAGTQHDQVHNNFVGKTDSLNGTLNISLINGFIPSLGDSVIIETHNALVGTFSGATGLSIPGGLVWNIFYRPNTIVLRAGNPANLNITSSAGPNGTIAPLGITSIFYNGTQKYTITPTGGYHVDSVIVDGTKVDSTTSYTFTNVITDHTIRVTFAVTTFPITSSTGPNGIILPLGVTDVPQGGSQQYTFTANPCYLLDSVFVDGNYIGNPANYTFNNVQESHTIRSVFRNAPKITANGPLTFCQGGNVTLDAGAGYDSYVWSNGATTQTTNVSASDTYSCTITSTGGCSNTTSVTVTVNPLPTVTFGQLYAADNGNVCLDGPGIDLSVNGTGSPAGGGYSGTGVVYNIHTFFSPITAGVGTHTLTYTYTDGNGCTNSNTTQVTVNQNATVSAGADITLCKNLVTTLAGTANGTAGTVTWTSGGTGQFSDSHSLTSTYTLSSEDSIAGSVTLTLTSSDPAGPCPVVSDQVIVIYNPDAIPDAGPAEICTQSTVSLSGSISGYPATPHWSTMGTGNFANPDVLSTTYTASSADLAAGKVKLILTPIDPQGNCTFGSDTLVAWFDPEYTVDAGSDVLLCGINDTIAQLSGSYTSAALVTWTTNGSGTFSDIHDVNASYTLSSSDRFVGSIILTLTTDDPAGPCNATANSLVVNYKYAIGDAGATNICGDTNTALVGAVNTNILSGSTLGYQWTTSGSGNFSSPTLYYTNYHASNADIAAGQVKIYFTPVDGAQQCTYVKDSTTIWFTPHYHVNAGPDTTSVCSNDILILSGSAENVTGTTWTTSGSGDFGDAFLLNTTYTPSLDDSLAGHIMIYLTSDDPSGPCSVVVDSMYVIIHPAPGATAGSNSPACVGSDLDLTASGGSSYSWTGPNGFASTDQNIIRTPATLDMAGTYSVIVTSAFGCSNPASTEVVVAFCGCVPPTLSDSKTDVTCFDGSDGAIDLHALGGSGGNTYLWSNGETTEDISGLVAGTYTVTVTADGGCSVTLVDSILQPEPLAVKIATDNGRTVICDNGALGLDAGFGFELYIWSTGELTRDITVTAPDTYLVIVVDSKGCSAVDSVVITQSSPIVVTAVPGVIGCHGGATNVEVSATGGSGNYISGTGTLVGVPAGQQTFTVTDDNGCAGSATITIAEPDAIIVTATPGAIKCNGGTTTLTVDATGGSGIFNSGTGSFSGQNGGNHTYVVTDDKGCSDSATIFISEPAAISGTVSVVNASCSVCADGSVTVVTATGGTGNLQYTNLTGLLPGKYCIAITDDSSCTGEVCGTVGIAGSCTLEAFGVVDSLIKCNVDSTTITITAQGGSGQYTGTGVFKIGAGPYEFTVTDANDNSCTSKVTGAVSQPDAIVVIADYDSITCNGGTTTVQISATGGSGNYISGTGALTDVHAGTYTYAVIDNNGCSGSLTVTITEPDSITVVATVGSIKCNGGTTSVDVSATGGSGIYANGTGSISSQTAGSHTYTVTDNKGCTGSTTISISQPDAITGTVSVSNASCGTCADGSVTVVTATGGTGTLQYTNLTGLLPGVHCITITDDSSCTGEVCGTVGVGACNIQAFGIVDSAIKCNGDSTTITISATGGSGQYNGVGTFKIGAGAYQFTVTDANDNNCTSTVSGSASEPAALVVTAIYDSIRCYGTTTNVTVSATGGSGNYTSGTGIFSGIGAGLNTFTVTDDNGCTGSVTIDIIQPDSVTVTAIPGVLLCHGDTTSVTVTASGGSGNYIGTGVVHGVSAGLHTYEVKDEKGCVGSVTINIAEPDAIVVIATPGAIACHGGSTSVTVSATGGSGNYVFGTGVFTAVAAGIHNYIVIDDNGCSGSSTITVTQPDSLYVIAGSNSPLCVGNTLNLSANGAGGTGVLSYAWSGPNGFNSAIQNPVIAGATAAETGTYKVTVTDVNNCSAIDSVVVAVNPAIKVTIGSIPDQCVTSPPVTLTGSPAGGIFSGTGVVGTTFNPSVSGVGTFIITYTYNGGSCPGNNSASTSVTVTAAPTVGITITTPLIGCIANTIYIGYGPQSATLAATVSGSIASYQWYVDGNSIPGATTATYIVTTAGNYTVKVTGTGGCATTSASVKINVVDIRCGSDLKKVQVCHNAGKGKTETLCIPATAVDAHIKNHADDCLGPCGLTLRQSMPELDAVVDLNIYPNPFSTSAEVVFSLTESGAVRLELYDLKGALLSTLYAGEVEGGEKYNITINGANMPVGMYFVRLVTEDKIIHEKLILAK